MEEMKRVAHERDPWSSLESSPVFADMKNPSVRFWLYTLPLALVKHQKPGVECCLIHVDTERLVSYSFFF